METKICRLHLPTGRVWEFSYTSLRAGAAAVLLIGSVLSGTAGYLYYCLNDYRREAKDFAEYKLHKKEQQTSLQQLVQDNEKMLRDIKELSVLEHKLQRAIMEEAEGNKPEAGNISLSAPSHSSMEATGKMNAGEVMTALQAQNDQLSKSIIELKASVKKLLAKAELSRGTLAFFPNYWPTHGQAVSSSYGARTEPVAGGHDWHPGIDIAVDFGVPVYAAGAGTIEQSGWNGGYGRSVRIDHGNGYTSIYGHMSSLAVAAEQQVIKGEIIGFAGSSGYSTGPHLHFEVLADGENIDPFYILKKRG